MDIGEICVAHLTLNSSKCNAVVKLHPSVTFKEPWHADLTILAEDFEECIRQHWCHPFSLQVFSNQPVTLAPKVESDVVASSARGRGKPFLKPKGR